MVWLMEPRNLFLHFNIQTLLSLSHTWILAIPLFLSPLSISILKPSGVFLGMAACFRSTLLALRSSQKNWNSRNSHDPFLDIPPLGVFFLFDQCCCNIMYIFSSILFTLLNVNIWFQINSQLFSRINPMRD